MMPVWLMKGKAALAAS